MPEGAMRSPSAPRPIPINRPSGVSIAPARRSKSSRSRRGLTLSITTKSDLVARDIPLLREIAKRNSVSVNVTITTLDTSLARLLEPRAPRPELRLKAVRAIADAGIPVGVFPNPIMPLITDQPERLDRLAKAARDQGATYFGGGVLFLMPCSRKVFFPFVEKNFPHLLRRYREKYERESLFERAVPGNNQGKNRRDSRQVRARCRPAPPRSRVVAEFTGSAV